MGLLDYPSMKNKHVIVKPNFNTADPPPASTHNDTLSQLITEIRSRNASEITLAERSYQSFDEVIAEKEIKEMAEELGFKIKDLDLDDYTHFKRDDLHWENGFRVPNIINNAEYIVSTCCLKTHFKGVITMSLKLSVGILPKMHMRELHSSQNINSMIAEINLAYEPDLIVMDGVKTFISGGPSKGTVADGNVVLAGTDAEPVLNLVFNVSAAFKPRTILLPSVARARTCLVEHDAVIDDIGIFFQRRINFP